jgi:hypothetical protein
LSKLKGTGREDRGKETRKKQEKRMGTWKRDSKQRRNKNEE